MKELIKVGKFAVQAELQVVKNFVAWVMLLVELLRWGTIELAKVVKRNPVPTILVVGITSVFTVMGATLLAGEEFQALSAELKIVTMCGIGLGSFIGSISFSQRVVRS